MKIIKWLFRIVMFWPIALLDFLFIVIGIQIKIRKSRLFWFGKFIVEVERTDEEPDELKVTKLEFWDGKLETKTKLKRKHIKKSHKYDV